MDYFYVTLPSNSSFNTFSENTTTSYTTQLYKRVELEGKWNVAIVELQYPNTILNIADSRNSMVIEFKDGTRKTLVLPTGYYTNVESVVTSINSHEIVRRFKIRVKYIKSENKVGFSVIGADVGNLYFSDSVRNILGFSHERIFYAIDSVSEYSANVNNGLPNQIYIYCDIIENNMVGDTTAPLLRAISVDKSNHVFGTGRTIVFESPHYVPVMKRSFDTIDILLRSEKGKPIPFAFGTSCVKLHFKRAL